MKESVSNKHEAYNREVENLQKKAQESDGKIQRLEEENTKLKYDMENCQNEMKKGALIFRNVPTQQGENPLDLIRGLLVKASIDVNQNAVVEAYRLGGSDINGDAPIKCIFIDSLQKEKILNNAKIISDSNNLSKYG